MKNGYENSKLSGNIKDCMVAIPEGEITMRDDRVKREWITVIKPFWLSKYLLTQDLYFEITGLSPACFKGGEKPVENITWRDAVKCCNLLSDKLGKMLCYVFDEEKNDYILNDKADGFRLPYEAEWEYACKAGTSKSRYGEIERIAWYKENSNGQTHQIATKEPNDWGLYDMLGNVWEWCSDIYDETVYGSYRVFRGGGWNDEERGCLATNRRRSHPVSFKIDDLGFRLARNLII